MYEEEKDPRELFTFPISLPQGDARMKNINLANIPKFHNLTFEDLDTFLIHVEVICISFGYTLNSKNLRLFP